MFMLIVLEPQFNCARYTVGVNCWQAVLEHTDMSTCYLNANTWTIIMTI